MKKGSLSLSMNAIVILILAITLLGLGLSFMRGLFQTMQTKVAEAVSAQELVNPPTTDNQLTIAPSELQLKARESGKVLLAFMSTDSSTQPPSCGIPDSQGVVCNAQTGYTTTCETIEPIYAKYSSNNYVMPKNQVNVWTIAIPGTVVSGGTCTYLCTAKMQCGMTIGWGNSSR